MKNATAPRPNNRPEDQRQGRKAQEDIGTDPYGKHPKQGGCKLDKGKPPGYRGLLALFPRAVSAVSLASAHGAAKYTWTGWREVPEGVERYSDALVRHLIAESKEGPLDHDSGLHHAAHVAWNALARLELILECEESMAKWAQSDEADRIVEDINGSYYLQPGK